MEELKVKKNISKYISNIKAFAFYFLMITFIDIVLFVITSYGAMDIEKNYLHIFFMNVSLAGILQFLCVRFDRRGMLISNVVVATILLLSIVEIVIFQTFDAFMPPFGLLKNTTNVATTFTNDLLKIVRSNIIFILFLIAVFIAFVIISKKVLFKKRSRKSFVSKDLIYRRVNVGILIFSILLFTFSFILSDRSNNFTLNLHKNGLKTALIADMFKKEDSIKLVQEEEVQNEVNIEEDEKAKYLKEYNVLDIDFANLDTSEVSNRFKDINMYVDSRRASKKNVYTGLFKGKNLILICAEAFSSRIIDENLTPTLYRLTNNGFKFTDYYVPSWGGSTISGEYAFLNGIIPEYGTESLKDVIGKNMCFTLPRALKREGYNTGAFHSGSAIFYDRDKSHGKNLGFDYYLANGTDPDNIVGGWVDDIGLLSNTIDFYYDKKPFCMYYMTLSGHAFYNDNNNKKVYKYIDRVKNQFGDKYPDQVNNYFCYQLYLEDALKVLLEKLEKYNLIDDTVICMNSDHYPYGLYNNAFTDNLDYLPILYDNPQMDPFDRDKNMPVIWCRTLEDENFDLPKTIDLPASSLDLVPTLLNLYGLDFDSRLLVGRDVFSDLEAVVPYNNGGYITSEGRKYSSFSRGFHTYSGDKVDEEYVKHLNEVVNNFNTFSKFVVDNDYYNYIFTNKEVSEELRNKMTFEKEVEESETQDAIEMLDPLD